MKPITRLAALLTVLLVMAGCVPRQETAPEKKTIHLYYRAALESFEANTTAFGTQDYTYTAGETELAALLETYFSGPDTENLTSAFPKGTKAANMLLSDGVLQIWLTGGYGSLTGMERTLADACLTLTLTQLDAIGRVCVLAEGERADGQSVGCSAQDFVLLDLGSAVSEETLKVYFADEARRYLLPELRQAAPADPEALTEYLICQLIAGPTQEGHTAAIPQGTELLGTALENGVCTVNLSAAFLENRPRTEAEEWLTVYAIVNSLTQLEEIDSVRILCQGEVIEYLCYMKLDQPLTQFEGLIGPVRYGLNEFDATIYLGSWSPDYLTGVPARLRQTTAYTQEELLLNTLLSYAPPVGYQNIIPAGTQVLSVETSDGVCAVDLSDAFARQSSSLSEQRQRVNALTASLCSLSGVSAVLLTIEGQTVSLGGYDLALPLSPALDWFFP